MSTLTLTCIAVDRYAAVVHPYRARMSNATAGMNCIKIGLPGKLILSKRKGLLEVLFA